MTEKQLREQFVNTLKSYAGFNERDGSHKKIVDLYNSIKPLPVGYKLTYTDWWCASFPSAVAWQLGITDIVFPECSCERMITLYKKAGRWIEADDHVPEIAELIMYDWDDTGVGDNTGNADHVGVVVARSGNTLTIIEGNMSNKVGYRTLQVNAKYIRGYCSPDYASKTGTATPTPTPTPTPAPAPAPTPTPAPTKSIAELAEEVKLGKWGNGAERKKRLTAAGYDYDAVQAAVNGKVTAGPATKPTTEQLAKEVIAGKWGNGADRKKRLEAAGYNYSAVQATVNKLLSK